MGGVWAGRQGSPEPPALIVMTYEAKLEKGKTPAAGAPVLGLVGKGITFGTGGISIKPADGMEKMKYDMAGAGAVVGALRAVARLKPKVVVVGAVCSSGNVRDWMAVEPRAVVVVMLG